MSGLSENMRGALLMTICMVAFTINDAFMKAVLVNLPLFQALFLRGALTTLCLLVLALGRGGLRMPTDPRDRRLIVIRTLAEIVAAWLFLTALQHMPIANISAILQVLPLSVTLASALFFREPLGWRRLSAIAVGFCGVLLIVRPGTEGFNLFSLYALASVVAVTVRDLAARRLSPDTPSLTVALITAVGVAVAAGVASLFVDWAPVSPSDALWLGSASVFVIAGYLCSVMAMRGGDIGVIAPFRYSSLIAALILGWAIFDEWPTTLTLIGAFIVVATGVFTLYREQRLARARRLQPLAQSTGPRSPAGC